MIFKGDWVLKGSECLATGGQISFKGSGDAYQIDVDGESVGLVLGMLVEDDEFPDGHWVFFAKVDFDKNMAFYNKNTEKAEFGGAICGEIDMPKERFDALFGGEK